MIYLRSQPKDANAPIIRNAVQWMINTIFPTQNTSTMRTGKIQIRVSKMNSRLVSNENSLNEILAHVAHVMVSQIADNL